MQIVKQSAAAIDKLTQFPIGMTGDHAYIHKGKGYTFSGNTGSLAAAATYTIALLTPNDGKYVHLRPTGLSSTANTLQMRIAEASIVTGGSAGTLRNRNRNIGRQASSVLTVGVTLSSEGTVLQFAQVGAGSNAANATGGGNDGSAEEWVLKPNTVYTFRFENIGSVTATTGYFNMFFYEEDFGGD